VSVPHAVKAEVRLYDRLFNVEDPTDESQDFMHYLNPASLEVLPQVMAEPSLLDTNPGDRYQFVRKGYFVLDKDSQSSQLVFNKTVGLKDGWSPSKG
jgi:glutaminyl-tRNA synthetase